MSFNVHTDDLHNLARGLEGLLQDFEDCGSQLRSGDPGAAGHPSLIEAMDAFRSVWAAAVDDFHAKVSLLSTNIGLSADAYEQADTSVRSAFER